MSKDVLARKNIHLGKIAHERSLRIRDFLYKQETFVHGLVKGEPMTGLGCEYCTRFPYDKKEKSFSCPECDSVLYCSVECCERDKKMHNAKCNEREKAIKEYRKSINWYGHEQKGGQF